MRKTDLNADTTLTDALAALALFHQYSSMQREFITDNNHLGAAENYHQFMQALIRADRSDNTTTQKRDTTIELLNAYHKSANHTFQQQHPEFCAAVSANLFQLPTFVFSVQETEKEATKLNDKLITILPYLQVTETAKTANTPSSYDRWQELIKRHDQEKIQALDQALFNSIVNLGAGEKINHQLATTEPLLLQQQLLKTLEPNGQDHYIYTVLAKRKLATAEKTFKDTPQRLLALPELRQFLKENITVISSYGKAWQTFDQSKNNHSEVISTELQAIHGFLLAALVDNIAPAVGVSETEQAQYHFAAFSRQFSIFVQSLPIESQTLIAQLSAELNYHFFTKIGSDQIQAACQNLFPEANATEIKELEFLLSTSQGKQQFDTPSEQTIDLRSINDFIQAVSDNKGANFLVNHPAISRKIQEHSTSHYFKSFLDNVASGESKIILDENPEIATILFMHLDALKNMAKQYQHFKPKNRQVMQQQITDIAEEEFKRVKKIQSTPIGTMISNIKNIRRLIAHDTQSTLEIKQLAGMLEKMIDFALNGDYTDAKAEQENKDITQSYTEKRSALVNMVIETFITTDQMIDHKTTREEQLLGEKLVDLVIETTAHPEKLSSKQLRAHLIQSEGIDMQSHTNYWKGPVTMGDRSLTEIGEFCRFADLTLQYLKNVTIAMSTLKNDLSPEVVNTLPTSIAALITALPGEHETLLAMHTAKMLFTDLNQIQENIARLQLNILEGKIESVPALADLTLPLPIDSKSLMFELDAKDSQALINYATEVIETYQQCTKHATYNSFLNYDYILAEYQDLRAIQQLPSTPSFVTTVLADLPDINFPDQQDSEVQRFDNTETLLELDIAHLSYLELAVDAEEILKKLHPLAQELESLNHGHLGMFQGSSRGIPSLASSLNDLPHSLADPQALSRVFSTLTAFQETATRLTEQGMLPQAYIDKSQALMVKRLLPETATPSVTKQSK